MTESREDMAARLIVVSMLEPRLLSVVAFTGCGVRSSMLSSRSAAADEKMDVVTSASR
jgi:hypothetical protein